METGSLRERGAGVFEVDGFFKFRTHGDRVGTVNRRSHAGDGGFKIGQMHDATTLILHFHFLFRVAGIEEGIDLRDHVKGDLMREYLFQDRFVLRHTIGLMAELIDRAGTGSRDGLVAGGKNPLQTELAVQWVERKQGDRCGTIRIGQDALVVFDVGAVDFRNNERNVGVHAKSRRIIHHDSSVTDGLGCEIARDRSPRAKDRNVDILKRIHIKRLDRVGFSPEGERLAGRTRRG